MSLWLERTGVVGALDSIVSVYSFRTIVAKPERNVSLLEPEKHEKRQHLCMFCKKGLMSVRKAPL
jgi:hypothetical protein